MMKSLWVWIAAAGLAHAAYEPAKITPATGPRGNLERSFFSSLHETDREKALPRVLLVGVDGTNDIYALLQKLTPDMYHGEVHFKTSAQKMATASALLAAPIFEKRATRWVFTLGTPMPSCLAMSSFVSPRVNDERISFCHGESLGLYVCAGISEVTLDDLFRA